MLGDCEGKGDGEKGAEAVVVTTRDTDTVELGETERVVAKDIVGVKVGKEVSGEAEAEEEL